MVVIMHPQVVILKQRDININEEQRKDWFLSKGYRNGHEQSRSMLQHFFDREQKPKRRSIAAFIA